MADEVREEDEWLYGESEPPKVEPTEPFDGETPAEIDYKQSMGELPSEDGTAANEQEGDTPADDANNEGDTEDDDDDDDSDDDGVQVVIGDIKAGQSTFAQAAKRVGPPPDKKGKFSVEDFESSGTINGVPAQDFSLDSMEEKPWRKPGADITDYFNYGFTEDTWRAYCDRQKRLRYESGTNLPTMMSQGKHQTQDSRGLIPVAISNDNSKYAGQSNIVFPKKFGMQGQGRKEDMMMNRRREEPKENTIQVMTADRREYSRKAFDMPPPIAPPFDMSVPPPSFPPPDAYIGGAPEFFNPHQPPPQFYHEEHGGDYEEQNWMDSSWNMEIGMPSGPGASSSVVSLTKATTVPPPPGESVDDSSSSVSSKEDKKSKSDK